MTALRFRDLTDDTVLDVHPTKVLIAGFTGSDTDAVEAHIRELEAEGIPRPPSVPTLYEVSPERLTQERRVAVAGTRTSGEVEPVLVCTDTGWFVTVGSDHTDRELEREDIARSKDACPKPVGTDVLPFEQVRDRWAQMQLRSWAGSASPADLYQDGPLASIRAIDGIVEFVSGRVGPLEPGTFVFLGTVPLRNGGFIAAPHYVLELVDEERETRLRLTYDVDMERIER